MSILKQKLDKSAELFQTHSFKEALLSYQDSLAFCYKTRESQGIIFNIMTAKAALHSILGQNDKAMNTLNQVLRTDSNHYLALIRRSQVYKKKGKFNRALKDLELVATFCPDNLQVTAMKIQIQTLKSKCKESNSSSQSQSDDEFNEQIQLNFSNLKKIDRKSCSIVVDPLKGRKSRVTISGDTAFEYEQEQVYEKSNISTSASKENNQEKYKKTQKEIQTENDVAAPASKVVVKPTGRTKSILKNKIASSFISTPPLDTVKEEYVGRQSRFVDKIKDIDGKVISSNHSIGSQKGIREVQFRKSMFSSQEKAFQSINIPQPQTKQTKKSGRKSCLKRSSFDKIDQQVKIQPVRKSKFEMLSRNSIDGAVIKNRKSIQVDYKTKNSQESDQGSEHNIFGSNENVMISKEMKEKLGLNKDKTEEKGAAKPRANGGKSILKKGSVFLGAPEHKRDKSVELQQIQEEDTVRPKKSVMFTKSKFAS